MSDSTATPTRVADLADAIRRLADALTDSRVDLNATLILSPPPGDPEGVRVRAVDAAAALLGVPAEDRPWLFRGCRWEARDLVGPVEVRISTETTRPHGGESR